MIQFSLAQTMAKLLAFILKSGRERWRFRANGPIPSSPALGEGVVYVGSLDHTVYALPT